MVALLINYATELGYEITFADAYRSPEYNQAIGGHRKSLHTKRLAIDLNLFKDGRFLTATKDHEPLGLFWESIGGAWGGRFNDGNHYSLEHEGMK